MRFDRTERLIRIYEGTRYLTLFGSKKYDAIYNRIRYLISLKSSITYIFSHYFAKIKVGTFDSLPMENIDFAQCYNTHCYKIQCYKYNVIKSLLL